MDSHMQEKLNLTRDILLGIAGVGGILLITAIAPGAIGVLAPLLKKKYKKNTLKPSYLQNKFRELNQQGLIMIGEQNGQIKISLTKEGKRKVLSYQIDNMQLKKPNKWDGQWRIVVFDIPERIKKHRDTFRRKLIDLEFERIQDSVWISKYPCREEIDFLAHLFEIWPYIDLIEGKFIKL
ncbi:TPA: hypothetical protein DIV45_01425 [Patescibacteria group bacterium]|nr:hypothetical protein [Patescibacteria group bacterium]